MIEKDKMSREEFVAYYRPEVEKLVPYIPWLEKQKGRQVSNLYNGDGLAENSISVPVYDSTLLAFVKAARATSLLDRNYVYVYSRNRIRTVEDERRFIQKAELVDMDGLCGILSKYVLKGMTKSVVWTEGVKNGIFLELLLKMRELITFWDKPME
ncbi:MAG: hypothetical protein ACI4SZ_04490 [Lachnospiraceae bacterium]